MASTPSTAPTAIPPMSFGIAFERLRDLVSKDDARRFTSTTMEDVWNTAKDVERQLELRRSLRGFHRIQPFLAGIEKYSGVVEVLCQGTPYLPYIWAPIKLLLQIAQGHIAALEKLIDAYAMIGEAMPRFDRLSAAFKGDPEFLQVMGHFYEDILEFHRRAYKFFRQRAWKMVFDSLWKTFHLRFQGILDSLRKHRDLIDQEANAISIAEAKLWRSEQLNQIRTWRIERADEIEKTERERLATHTREAVAWLGASEEQEDMLIKFSRACDGTESHWALKEHLIVSWLDRGRDPSVVWLNGKPGAGKTVVCSKIIEHIQDQTDMVVIYYFCSHLHTFKRQANEVLRSLVTQLIAANTGLAPYILETFANNGLRPTKKSLGSILEKLIASLPFVRIVVDGLDECPQNDHDEIIDDLLRIKGLTPGACKVFISSRKIPSISKLLQTKPTFRLEDYAGKVSYTISSFVHSRLRDLHQDFALDVIDELGHRIIAKANGMFLWVKLVIFTLEDLYFERDIRDAVETLPEELDALWERIISRICGEAKTPNQRIASRMLQWMMVAQRPLKRFELESGIVLDDQTSHITTVTRARGDVLGLCNPVLDVEDGPGGHVSFSHFTALEYLLSSHSFSVLKPAQAQLTVSLSCVLYLKSSLDLVDPQITDHDSHSAVLRCLHDLHLYANDHWLNHLISLLDLTGGSLPILQDILPLRHGLECLASRHLELASIEGWSIRDGQELVSLREGFWELLDISPAVRSLLDETLVYRQKVSVKDGQTAKNALIANKTQDPTLFTTVRNRYQSIVEGLLGRAEPADPALNEFKARHESGAFLCRYIDCPRAATGFHSAELRQMHEESHIPRFQCTISACGILGRTFRTRTALTKHTAKYHDEEEIGSIPGCLSDKSRHLQQDRSLFQLNAMSAKRQRGDDLRFTFKATPPQNPAALQGDGVEDYTIKCICGFEHDDGYTVYCHTCDTWQHMECYYIDEHGTIPKKDDMDHFCADCQPRPLDTRAAVERQRHRRKEFSPTTKFLIARAEEDKNRRESDTPAVSESLHEQSKSGDQQSDPKEVADIAPPPEHRQPQISSYWSVHEQHDFYNLVSHFGTNWQAIAATMKTKTDIMIRNFYYRELEKEPQGYRLEQYALQADAKLATEQATGSLSAPMPTVEN